MCLCILGSVLLSCLAISGTSHAEAVGSLKGKRVAVLTFTTAGELGYESSAEHLIERVLSDEGAKVLDRAMAEELRKRYGKASDPDYVMIADDFLKDGSDYDFDVLVRCYLMNESRNALGGFTSATAQVVLKIVDADARVLGSASSPSLGTPGFPPSDGITTSAAVVNAVQRAAASACEELGLRVLAPPTPKRLSFSVGDAKGLSVGDGVTCLAPHPLLPRIVLGKSSGEITEWSVEGDRPPVSRSLGKAGIVWLGYSTQPMRLLAVDDAGMVHEVGTDLAWSTPVPSGVQKPSFASVSPDGRTVIVLDRQGKGALVDCEAKAARPFSAGTVRRLRGVATGKEPGVAYLIGEDGVRELRFPERTPPTWGRELVGTATGETWSQASIQQAAVSPDGGLLAAALLTMDIDLLRGQRTDRVDVRLIDVQTGRLFASMKPGQYVGLSPKDVTALTFGPDWRFMAAGSRENIVRVWNTESGQQQFEFRTGTTKPLSRLATGYGGRMLVGLAAGEVRYWSVETAPR